MKLLKLAQVLPLWSTACGDDLYHWLWWWFNQMFLYVIIIIWNSTADRESRNSRYASTQSNIHANKSKHALKGAQEQGHRRPWPPWPACDSRPVVRFCFLDSVLTQNCRSCEFLKKTKNFPSLTLHHNFIIWETLNDNHIFRVNRR